MKSLNKEIIILVTCLFLLGGGMFLYRLIALDFPLFPNETVQSWHVETKLTFTGASKPLKVDMYLPRSSYGHTVVDENYVSNGFGITSREDDVSKNRIVTWTKREPTSKEILYYRGILYETHSATSSKPKRPVITVPVIGSEVFESLSKEQSGYFALKSIIEDIHGKSADHETFALALFQFVKNNKNNNLLIQIKEKNEEIKSEAGLVSFILNHAGIPARVMNGVALKQTTQHASFESRAQVFLNNKWLYYNPENHTMERNKNFLEWWVGRAPFYTSDNKAKPVLDTSVKKHTENALTEAIWKGDSIRAALYKISIFNLPVDVQLVFSVLLLIPLGALVVAIMRQIIGIETFGTFMPVLVALSFRETQLLWGLIFFTVITAIGMAFRSYLNRLQLLMVPRLSAIMILVVLSIYIISVLMFSLNMHIGLSISLFPLIILTMLIERMSVTWEEYGASSAMKSAIGSIFVAVISYLVMNNELLNHLMVTFPELLLVLFAVAILIGRYNGYKLTEYFRFRALTKEQ